MALSSHLAALLCGALLLTACGDSVEVTDLGKLEKPAQHDAAAATVQEAPAEVERRVVVPDEVRKRFTAVTLTIKRGAEATPLRLTQQLGTTRQLNGLTLTVGDYLPAFFMDNGAFSSQGSDESNPAVWLEAVDGAKLLYRGWLFRDYPELNPPQEPGFEILLVEAVKGTQP